MSTEPRQSDHPRFDNAMRALHQASLAQVSPQVRWKLRPASTQPKGGVAGWFGPLPPPRWTAAVIATMAAAALGLALWTTWLPSGPTPGAGVPSAAAVVTADPDDAATPLDQDPDFYAWLASDDASMLAME